MMSFLLALLGTLLLAGFFGYLINIWFDHHG